MNLSTCSSFDNLIREFVAGNSMKGKLYSLPALEKSEIGKISRLPVSIRIVLESVLRNCDRYAVTERDVANLKARRAVENDLSENLVKARMIASLPDVAAKLPVPKELKSVSISGDGAADRDFDLLRQLAEHRGEKIHEHSGGLFSRKRGAKR